MNSTDKMKWMETKHEHPEIDRDAETYFITSSSGEMMNEFHFDNLPQLKKLLESRLEGSLSEKEILMAARETFKNKPKRENVIMDDSDRDIVDFIYEM